MTPKEKAKELVDNMFNVDLDCDNESMCMLYPHAKQCAIIAVDELIKNSHSDKRTEYWEQVKHEINKL